MVGAGVAVLPDPRLDGRVVAPRHQGVDQPVAASGGEVVVGEAEAEEVVGVVGQGQVERQVVAAELAGDRPDRWSTPRPARGAPAHRGRPPPGPARCAPGSRCRDGRPPCECGPVPASWARGRPATRSRRAAASAPNRARRGRPPWRPAASGSGPASSRSIRRAWLTPIPTRNRSPWVAVSRAWASAASSAGCIHRLRMPVAMIAAFVAARRRSTTSNTSPPTSGTQRAE